MAWIKQASVLVASVLMASTAIADEARANRPINFVLPEPVVPEEPSLPGAYEPTIAESVPLTSDVEPLAAAEKTSAACRSSRAKPRPNGVGHGWVRLAREQKMRPEIEAGGKRGRPYLVF